MRNSLRQASKKDWPTIAKDLKPPCTAASKSNALHRFVEFNERWEKRYPAIIRLWTYDSAEFVPSLQAAESDTEAVVGISRLGK